MPVSLAVWLRAERITIMPSSNHDGAKHFLSVFSDPKAVARNAEGPRRFVPGIESLHRMTGILLAERVPSDAAVLVLGAGGGLELKAMAEAYAPGASSASILPRRCWRWPRARWDRSPIAWIWSKVM
jgi:hypothetical protein